MLQFLCRKLLTMANVNIMKLRSNSYKYKTNLIFKYPRKTLFSVYYFYIKIYSMKT